ncbi:MAG: hypothetical protein N3A66_00955 [Planctomycetota bacterium]|nr:hypothetical protein [Planctomycetota bacterium]
MRFAIGFAAVVFAVASLAAEEKVETYPDGKPRLRYQVDAAGKKHGSYVEYYESGKEKIRANYREDLLDGKYLEKDESGKTLISATYRAGVLHGEYTLAAKKIVFPGQRVPMDKYEFMEGVLLYTKPLETIKKTLAKLESREDGKKKPSAKAGGKDVAADIAAAHQAALRRLQAYRFICDVPYENVVLDAELTKYAEAGAKLCEKIGRIDHKPANPGLPEEEYRLGFKGTSESNLAQGQSDLTMAVDCWLYDSDPSNIDRVGHRRWCLNPRLAKTGFGDTGKFFAMYAFDQSATDIGEWEFVCFPARGYMPLPYFRRLAAAGKGEGYAWHVSLNPDVFAAPAKESVKVRIYPMEKGDKKAKEPLALDYFNVENGGFGSAPAIIFRPDKAQLAPDARFWVEITGVKDKAGKDTVIRYLVHFVAL